ncbi:hypothetical protein CROQUDRAFT_14052, partial [Cronartium quercuum f. sp. fusiforme G11]
IKFLTQCMPECHPVDLSQLWFWTYRSFPLAFIDPPSLIAQWGIPQRGQPDNAITILQLTLLLPVRYCLTCDMDQQYELKSKEQLYAYLYDCNGFKSVQYLTYYSDGTTCGMTFRPSYYSRHGMHFYYTTDKGMSDKYFQVSQHYFMSHAMAHQHNMLQMLGHLSVFTMVNSYNSSFATGGEPNVFPDEKFGPQLSAHICLHGLDIHHLL